MTLAWAWTEGIQEAKSLPKPVLPASVLPSVKWVLNTDLTVLRRTLGLWVVINET